METEKICPICRNPLNPKDEDYGYIPTPKQIFLDDGKMTTIGIHRKCFIKEVEKSFLDEKMKKDIIEGFDLFNSLTSPNAVPLDTKELIIDGELQNILDKTDGDDMDELVKKIIES